MKRKLLTTLAFIHANILFASTQVEMADTMRSNGKIYVVVAVLATIFAGIFGYLIYIDRKINKTEKETKY